MAFFWFGALKCINEKVIDFFCRRNDVNRYSAHDCKLRFQDTTRGTLALCPDVTAMLLIMDMWWSSQEVYKTAGLYRFPGYAVASLRKSSQILLGLLPLPMSTLSRPLASFGLYSLMKASNAESVVCTNEIICCDWGLGAALLESNLQFPPGDRDPRYSFMMKIAP